MKKFVTFFVVLSLTFSSCEKNDDQIQDTDSKWWILIHPTHGNEGIYLYNETTSSIERKIELPNGFSSPHALDFDGESLWLGGFHDSASLLKLSAIDGSIQSEIKNIRTEGIACLDDYIYYSGSSSIYKIDKTGKLIQTISTETEVIQDIAINESTIYYVFNGAIDPIIKIGSTGEERITDSEVSSLYTLAIRNENLAVVTNNNEIRRFEINTGEKISDTKLNLEGWITAIVPYNN